MNRKSNGSAGSRCSIEKALALFNCYCSALGMLALPSVHLPLFLQEEGKGEERQEERRRGKGGEQRRGNFPISLIKPLGARCPPLHQLLVPGNCPVLIG